MNENQCNNARNSKKRRYNEIESNPTDPAPKKRKIELPLLTRNCLKINVERTIAELEDIPSVMNGRKMRYLLNKLYIAANIKLNSMNLLSRINHEPFYERVCTFIDDQNNICLITDNYTKELLLNILEIYFKSCSMVEIYHNPPKYGKPSNEIHFNLENYTFSMHRTYVLILRVPYKDFVEKYRNSFEEFVFNAAQIFSEKASEFVCAQPQPKTLLHIFADFFDDDANFDPKSVLSSNDYHDLFQVYHQKYPQPEPCLYAIFIILYELYNKPWIKMKEIEESIKMCWQNLQQKLDYFESEIAENIIEFVQEKGEEYDFERFIEDEKLKSKNNETHFEAHHVIGRYTHLYEKDLFQKYRVFCLNPFRWKYLKNEEMEELKDKLLSNSKNRSISWEKMNQFDYFVDAWMQSLQC